MYHVHTGHKQKKLTLGGIVVVSYDHELLCVRMLTNSD